MFDVIAGASTGGILACAVVRARTRCPAAERLVGLYEERGAEDLRSHARVQRIRAAEGLARREVRRCRARPRAGALPGRQPPAPTPAPISSCRPTTPSASRPVLLQDPRGASPRSTTSRSPSSRAPPRPLRLTSSRSSSSERALVSTEACSRSTRRCRPSPRSARKWRPEVVLLSLGTGQHTRQAILRARSRTGGWSSGRVRSSRSCSTASRTRWTISSSHCWHASATGACRQG